jgi:hypothetical protein
MIDNIICRHKLFLKNNNINFKITPMTLLECTKKEFEIYIIVNLKENMTLENYGEWQVDHIYPISKINFKDNAEIYNLCGKREEKKIKSDKIL